MTDLGLVLPEIYLGAVGLALLLIAAWGGDRTFDLVNGMTGAAFAIGLFMLLRQTETGMGFNGMLIADPYARFVKALLLAASGLSLAMAPAFLRGTENAKPEYPVLTLFAALGMMLMVSANDLISVYVGLELQNLALYVLTAFRRDEARSSEAGLKYFTLSALSSAVLLFGLSLLYGFMGTTNFVSISAWIAQAGSVPAGVAVGAAFVIAGLAFKVSAVPFHMWTPDVYEGAPTPVTAFLAAAPKIAAVALLVRVLVGPLLELREVWQPVLVFLSVASMMLGGLAGLVQQNLKRLMAYSAIANVGALLVGLTVVGQGAAGIDGLSGLLLYLALYFVGTLTVFGVLQLLRRRGQPIEEIADLTGLAKTHPFGAAAMAAGLFSLAGVPPLAGFFGKYFVFLAAVKGGMTPLAVFGVLASVVAAAYYLKVVKTMYFDAPRDLPLDPVPSPSLRVAAGVSALAVLLFVLAPAPLMNAAREAAGALLSVQ